MPISNQAQKRIDRLPGGPQPVNLYVNSGTTPARLMV
jgi:hypothetical protein